MVENLPHDLPSPLDFPNTDVVIFDGRCRFCLSQVNRVAKWDRGKRLSYVSLHDDFVSENYPDLTHDQMMKQMYVVTQEDGKKFGGARALRFFTRRLPRLWWAAPFLHLPFSLPFWNWAYQQVAKRRYAISERMGKGCDGGTCSLHFGKK